MALSDREFLQVVKNAPLVSIDLILMNDEGQVLLGRRRNEPAKGYWFVPGGRIHKDEESISAAFARVARKELGRLASEALDFGKAKLLGAFVHKYATNFMEAPGIGTYYVVLAYVVGANIDLQELPTNEDDQHGDWAYFDPKQLLADEAVHENVKAYLPSGAVTMPT